MFFGSSMGCCPDQINPPNEKSSILVYTLRIMMYLELCFALLELYFLTISFGFFELIACLILYQGYTTLSYCHMIIYIYFIAINEIQFIIIFGTYAQNRQTFSWGFTIILEIILTAFYMVAIYYAFQAYKEFKGIAFDGTLTATNRAALNQQSSGYPNYGNMMYGNNGVSVQPQSGTYQVGSANQEPQRPIQATRGITVGGNSGGVNRWRDVEYNQCQTNE